MTEWEPYEHFKNAIASDYESFVVGAEAYRDHLASQCGDGCGSCSLYGTSCRPEETSDFCEFIRIWMSGYAKCEAEKAALAWEIVGFIRELSPATKAIADTVERWLASRGIERP